ncbi:ribosomal RNA processing protein 1 homolog A-like isoform X2 [Penaeus monodon]|uniref:ribosomal RNA processing protein 1 homolog A-like isoform X2 n=1 Tax=Penaeus monodon TaxID=6687 RepID=UPI0018A7640C|nr:ribosomal RNA processing protein 1 homolog A-like isoform X2 [Penaeus monodon]
MQESLFAQKLADNDKKNRDKAIKTLRKYFSAKSTTKRRGFSHDEMMKIWKGLFYCMYMADKPLVQEDLAESISALIHRLGNVEDRHNFAKCAFLTLAREWNNIDIFRMDKFMMFVRRILRQILVQLSLCNWNVNRVSEISNIIGTTVLVPDDHKHITPLGLKLHLSDIILEELAKIGREDIKNKALLEFLKPFIKVLALTKDKRYFERVSERIIRQLMRQSDEGIEYEASDDEDADEDSETGYESDLAEKENDEEEREDEGQMEEEEDEPDEDEDEDEVLDPRAGDVDVLLPQLQVDFDSLADAIQSVASVPNVSASNRDKMYKLVNELRDLAQGFYPLADNFPMVDKNGDIEGISEHQIDEAVERMRNYDGDGHDPLFDKKEARLNRLKERRRKIRKLKKEAEKKRKKILKKKLNSIMEGKENKKHLDNNRIMLEARKQQIIEKKLERLTTSSKKQKKSSPLLVNGLDIEVNNKRKAKIHGGFQVSELPSAQKSVKSLKSSGDVETLNSKRKGKKRKGEFAEQVIKTKKMAFQVSDISTSPGKADTKCQTQFEVTDISPKMDLTNLRNADKNNSKLVAVAPLVPNITTEPELNGIARPKKNELQESTKKTKVQHLGKLSGKGKAVSQAKAPMQNGAVSIKATGTLKAGEGKDEGEKGEKQIPTSNTTDDGKKKGSSMKSAKKAKKSAWDEPLKEGEVEVFIKSRKEIAKTKKNKKPSQLWRKEHQNQPKAQPGARVQ